MAAGTKLADWQYEGVTSAKDGDMQLHIYGDLRGPFNIRLFCFLRIPR